MTEIYGVDAQLYRNLPSEDQAAIRSNWQDQQFDARCVDVSGTVDRILEAPAYETTAALVDALQDMSPENAQKVLQELRERSPHDWHSLVSTSALSDLRGTDYPERGLRMLAEAIALEHASGNLDDGDILKLFGAGNAGFEQSQAAGAQMLFAASNSPEMQAFERAMADHALDTLAGADRRSASHGHDTLTTGVANIIIKGLDVDYSGRQALADAYAGTGTQPRTAEERAHIRDLLSDKGWVGAPHDVPGNPDALGVLMQSVAEMYGEPGTSLAVEFVNWAGSNQEAFVKDDIFGTSSSGPRAEALALITVNHAEAIFDDLTDGYASDSQYAGDDSRVLGFLLSVTASNLDNAHAGRVTRELESYADGLVAQVEADPNSQAAQEHLGRLEILAPALLIAEAAPYLHDLSSDASRVDAIMRLVDLGSWALGYVPGLGPGSELLTFINSRYGDANTLTEGQLDDAIREYLTEALSGSEKQREDALKEITGLVEARIEAQYGSVPAVEGAMTRRLEDHLYAMLVAISNDNVSGYLETLDLD